MRAVDIIAKKRDGKVLTRQEIEFVVGGFSRGDIPDYQASAWAMAVLLRGMTAPETTALTLAMANSGTVLDLSSVAPVVADKHSTGGVGDKTTLIVAPWVAACGVPVAKMSGRGLAHTGGTLDKLEAIPGYRVELSRDEFVRQVREHYIVVSGQTHELAPADGKLYALRDVTATVESIPLIASSIMSKKIAAGAQVIVLDVKVGGGAFMKTEAQGLDLAERMVNIGQSVGRRVSAVICDMEQPLGLAIGNTLEVIEAIEALKGRGPRDLVEHSEAIATQMLVLAGAADDETTAREKLRVTLEDGRALAKFGEWIEAQGGDRKVVNDYGRMPHAALKKGCLAERGGFIQSIDALALGLACVELGGGRSQKGDSIDLGVGLVLEKKVGDPIAAGELLVTIWANHKDKLQAAHEMIKGAILIGPEPVHLGPFLRKIVR